jgi:uncharacterized membrane protein
MSRGKDTEPPPAPYQIHWHVLLTHFPLSLISVSFLFQLLHLYAFSQCFELASNVLLVLGVASLVPTTWTGYHTWKRHYNGARASIFRRKILIAAALLLVGVPLCTWRMIYGGSQAEAARSSIHWPYFIGTGFMIVGAILEGYYGGRLSHRPRIPFSHT